MAQIEGTIAQRLALVDAIDHLLNRGVVLLGQTTVSLAGVDLMYLGLSLLVSSVETLEQKRSSHTPRTPASAPSLPQASDGSQHAADIHRLSARPGGAQSPRAYVTAPGARVMDSEPAAGGETPRTGTPRAALPPALISTGSQHSSNVGETPERGLARLVLTLVELLRQVLERQAIRRVEGGSLSDDQVERMGVALLELQTTMAKLRSAFGLTDDDLNLDLGPLGQVL